MQYDESLPAIYLEFLKGQHSWAFRTFRVFQVTLTQERKGQLEELYELKWASNLLRYPVIFLLVIKFVNFTLDRRPWAAPCLKRTHIFSGLRWLHVHVFSMPMIVQIHACQILGGWRGDQQRSHPGNFRETSSREERPAQQDEGGGEEEEDSSSHLSACHFFHFPPSFLVLLSWTETRFFNHATSSIKGNIPNLRN